MATPSSERRAAISFQVNTYNGDTYNGDISNSNVGGLGGDNKVESKSTSFAEGFKLLSENVAHQAFFDSGQAADPTKCHPGTREAIIGDLKRWAEHPEQDFPIKWVKGSAGVGKTVIVRTIAEWLAEREQLLASFFFWRSGQRCNNAQYFVATLSYQICQLLPDCKPLIARVVADDPHIFTRTVRVQVEKLVTNPITSIWRDKRPDTSGALVIVIDGLDECLQLESQSQDINSQPQDEDRQCEILREVHWALSQLQQHEIPLRLLIASRPERHIQEVFDRDLNQDASFIMLNKSYDATNDIRLYYTDKFRSICEHHPLRHYLPSSKWPSTNDMESLVRRASGQFIHASTVMQFISATKKNPLTQLQVILASKEHNHLRPLGKLDLLYQTIFSQINGDDWPATRQLLGVLLSPSGLFTREQHPTFWDLFLGWPSGEVERLLMPLDSVLEVDLEKSGGMIDLHECFHFYHASLQEFLLDPARSGPFSIDLDSTREKMAILCIQHLSTHDENISHYISLTMKDWLQITKFTPTLKAAFIKGGVNGVYPQNLTSAYPAFLHAITMKRIRQDPSTGLDLKGLHKEKHDLYLKMLQGVVVRYLDLKEDLSAYLLIVAAYYRLNLQRKGLFLDSLFVVDISDKVAQTDHNGLGLLDLYQRNKVSDVIFAKALSSIFEKMPKKGTLFARSASFFIRASHQYDYRAEMSQEDFLMSVAILLEHLLPNATPSYELRDCIRDYPIIDHSRNDPDLPYSIVKMKAAIAEYIAKVEAKEACLQSGSSDSQLNGQLLLLDTEIPSVELTPAVRTEPEVTSPLPEVPQAVRTEPEVTHPLPEVPQAKRKRKGVGQMISTFWTQLTGRWKWRQ